MTNKSKRTLGVVVSIVLIIIALVIIFRPSLDKAAASEYRTFNSPNGNYKIVVSRLPQYSTAFPGQAGDAPGYVRLYDTSGRVLEEKNVNMVQNIDQVYWDDDKVDIKLFAEWKLPR